MGFYLPGPTKGKVNHLIATHGAERISRPPDAFHGIPLNKALICVVDTVTYETANFCFSAVEMALLNDFDRLPAADLVAHGPGEGRGVVEIQDCHCRAQEELSAEDCG